MGKDGDVGQQTHIESDREAQETDLGDVKWFRAGYGFISPDGGGEDVFVHQSQIAVHGFRQLARGNRVEYVTVYDEDGRPRAKDVVILSTFDE